jgi:hypothetical protein
VSPWVAKSWPAECIAAPAILKATTETVTEMNASDSGRKLYSSTNIDGDTGNTRSSRNTSHASFSGKTSQ